MILPQSTDTAKNVMCAGHLESRPFAVALYPLGTAATLETVAFGCQMRCLGCLHGLAQLEVHLTCLHPVVRGRSQMLPSTLLACKRTSWHTAQSVQQGKWIRQSLQPSSFRPAGSQGVAGSELGVRVPLAASMQ